MGKFLLTFLLCFALGRSAEAASCCSGGAAVPSLILGDDRAQLNLSTSFASVIGDVPVSGLPLFRGPNDQELTETILIDSSMLISDRWQIGVSLPVIHKSHVLEASSEANTGLGDTSFTLAFEALPEWNYSAYRPRGFVFAQLVLPTGGSLSDPASTLGTSLLGRGFTTFLLGFVLTKMWGPWDVFFRTSFDQSFKTSVSNASTHDVLRSSPGVNVAMGGGWSPGAGNWRLGAVLNPAYEGPISSSGDFNSPGNGQLVWNATLQLSRNLSSQIVASLFYNDQTLFGPVQNVSLSRSVGLNFHYGWER